MPVKEVVDFFFLKEPERIDTKYYDPGDVNIRPEEGVNDLRAKFDITKPNPHGGPPLEDKICDGAGHFSFCPYYLIEVKTADIKKAIIQLKSTIEHVYKSGGTVNKVAIISDDNRWNDRLAGTNYKIGRLDDLLYKRKRIINERISIIHNGQQINFDIYCYLIDFKRYNLE